MATAMDMNLLVDCFICGRRREHYHPRQLACKHAFCLECLREKVTLLSEIDVQCPVCWQKTVLKEDGIDGLPLDNQVANAENALNVSQTVNKCFVCLQKGILKDAFARCNNCEFRLCFDCANSHKSKYSGHVVVEKVCKVHIREISHFCLVCNIGLCYECMVSSFHENHEVCELPDLKERATEVMIQGQRLLQGEVLRIQGSINKAMEKSMEVLTKARKEINENLDRHKSEITQMIGASMERREEYFNRLVTNTLEERSEACAHATNCVNELSLVDDGKFSILEKLCGLRHDIFKATDALRKAERQDLSFPSLEKDICTVKGCPQSRIYSFTCSLGDVNPKRIEKTFMVPKTIMHINNSGRNDDQFQEFGDVVALGTGSALFIVASACFVNQINVNGEVTAVYFKENHAWISSIDVDDGDIYIGGDNRVTVVSRGERQSFCLTHTTYITDIAVVGGELLIVADNGRLQRYTFQGDLIQETDTDGFTYVTSGVHPVYGPLSLVTNEGNQQLHIYKAGELVRKIGSQGEKDGQFTNIRGACMLPDGNILVADANLDRISEFSFEGEFVGHPLTSEHGINTPYSLSFGKKRLWIACAEVLLMADYT